VEHDFRITTASQRIRRGRLIGGRCAAVLASFVLALATPKSAVSAKIPNAPKNPLGSISFPARVLVDPPLGMTLTCADDYPNGAQGKAGTDQRMIKFQSADRKVRIEVSAAVGINLETNTVVNGHSAKYDSIDIPDLKAHRAAYVQGQWFVVVTIEGPSSSRSALEAIIRSLVVNSLGSIGYAHRKSDRILYDGRPDEGAYLPFYEFAFAGGSDRPLIRAVGFPSRLNPVELVSGRPIKIGKFSGNSGSAKPNNIPYVSWNPVVGTAVTVYVPGATVNEAIALAEKVTIVSEAEWLRKTQPIRNFYPERKGWSRCAP
jgi:hypothetical protein